MPLNCSRRVQKKSRSICPKGVVRRGFLVPTSVVVVEELRAFENSRNTRFLIKSKNVSVSKIRERISKSKIRRGLVKETRKILSPNAFMFESKINSKTMLVLIEAFLEGFKKTKPRNAFDIATRIRPRVPSITESLIQSYSNWVYSFLQEKEGLNELVKLRTKIKKN